MSLSRAFSLHRRRCLRSLGATASVLGLPDGFNHPRKIYDLTDSLVRRGYSDANIQAVLGGNFRRLLGDAWVAQPYPTEKQS
jgi:microsomal dipeptidase-like Zn-dependent dipeptidase